MTTDTPVAESAAETTPQSEKTEITVAELARFQDIEKKHKALIGYQSRNGEAQLKELQAKLEVAEGLLGLAEQDPDTTKVELVKVNLKVRNLEQKISEGELAKTAVILSVDHGIDAAELAGCKTVEEMRLKALELENKALKAKKDEPENTRPNAGINRGVGSGGKRIYTRAEVADYEFFSQHKEDINLARQEGRIK
jgi:hypothetical protein